MLDDRSQGLADPVWEAAKRIKKLEDENRALRQMLIKICTAQSQVYQVLFQCSDELIKAQEMLK